MLARTRAEPMPLVKALHNLFFPPASNFMPGASGSFYRTNVSFEEFQDAVASWCALMRHMHWPHAS